MAYEMRNNPGSRLGIWAETIEQKRIQMRLDNRGFPIPREEQEAEPANDLDATDNEGR